MFDLIQHTKPRARKRHRCSACWHDIAPGEVYTRQSIADRGSVRTWKECHQCIPGAFGFEGALRPEDAWREPGQVDDLRYDRSVVRLRAQYDYENVREKYREHVSFMVPLVGMTEWREVEQ